MVKNVVLTLVAQDRPGLVERVSGIVASHGGNWLESRMARLGGQFAGIVRIALPSECETKFGRDIAALGQLGLVVSIHPEVQPAAAQSAAQLKSLEVVGQDRPGIVSQISGALAAFGINVEDLETECSSAAMSGDTLFKANAKLSLPPGTDLEAVRKRLEDIASDLIVDISLEEIPRD